jgi:polyisoprenoid-binding protein YceI
MRRLLALSAAAAVAVAAFTAPFASGCEGPGAGKPAAEVGSAAGAATATAAASAAPGGAGAPVEHLRFGPDTSKIGFVAAKVSLKHDGGFSAFAGTLDFQPDHPEASRLSIDIDAASVWTDTGHLTEHLKTADFFDVATFPRATFVSTAIAPPAAPGGAWTITGDLSLHGVTKSIRFPANVTIAPGDVHATSEFSLQRKDFGILYPGAPDDLVNDDVLIKLDIRAPRAAP